ncbi:MAG: hypothetical protein FJ125_17805, partial [Deltaproteobacteria bacterium]|nr:hypothetical protein [Deltaproteobacteria bacterium]
MMRRRCWFGPLLAACSLCCATDEEIGLSESSWPEDEDVVDHGALDQSLAPEPASCASRWEPSSAALALGELQVVPYEGAGSRCSGGAAQGALELASYLREHFSALIDRRIPGDGIQIYNCRQVRGGQSLSLHATGRALDVFIPLVGGRANNASGDVIANWLVANAWRIGVQFIVWDRTRWKASGPSPRYRCYTGENPHIEHIHLELTRAAAERRTLFFQGEAPVEVPPPAPPAW